MNNSKDPIPIGNVIEQLKTKPLVINGVANIIAINELRKTNYKQFQRFQDLCKQETEIFMK